MSDIAPEPSAPPALEAPDGPANEMPPLLLLAVLIALLAIAAIVFLLVPTSWIGARVEVIYNQ
jgi:hypothetical protein